MTARVRDDDSSTLRAAAAAWESGCLRGEIEATGEWRSEFQSYSGIPVRGLYTPLDRPAGAQPYIEQVGFPGQYPYTRGVSATMYRGTMPRIYAYSGCGTAEETNRRYKYLLAQGARELIIAPDLPTQIGYDSDHELARGEVSKAGCAIGSLADMEAIFDGIPMAEVFIGAQTNANSVVMLALLIAAGERQGVPVSSLKLLVQNDVLKEYFARGTQIFPTRAGLKLSVDCMEYAVRNALAGVLPIIYCGYHTREAGGSAVHELGFTLADGAAYIEEFVGRGLAVDDLPLPRALFVAGLDLFEEVAKFRAYRRMWARMLRERFGATRSRVLGTTITCGSQASLYTAQQPRNNLVRGTIQALAQVLGGAQTTYIATMDEALSIPTEESATLSLRTLQIVHNECGIPNTVDPLGGSWYVESLTDEIERRTLALCARIDQLGGAVAAIDQGFQEHAIAEEAYRQARLVETGERVVVGVNRFCSEERASIEITRHDPREEQRQIAKLARLRRERDNAAVERGLRLIRAAAADGVNMIEPVLEAVRSYATMGEICDALRDVYGCCRRAAF
ncbi:MAG: methylmalonyl-CoA mutase [Gammaproteobacteria bacterium]|nr:methylmalonyl-CoA mutase [Gammaproteobacteria bacterium]